MPQLLLILLAGAGIYAGYRWYMKEQDKIKAVLKEAEDELRKRDDASIPTLKRDPETGEYVPGDRRD